LSSIARIRPGAKPFSSRSADAAINTPVTTTSSAACRCSSFIVFLSSTARAHTAASTASAMLKRHSAARSAPACSRYTSSTARYISASIAGRKRRERYHLVSQKALFAV